MPTATAGRFIDFPGGDPAFATEPSELFCAPRTKSRFIDLVKVDGNLLPVYGIYSECQKDWEGAVEFIAADCGDGVFVAMSKEIQVLLNAMEDCSPGAESCPETTLTYDEGDDRWKGDISLNEGTATFEMYCTFDGVDVRWWLESGGCAYPGTQELTVQCAHPPYWTGIGGSLFQLCCDDEPFLLEPSLIHLMGKVRPYKASRLVDVKGPGDGTAVFAVSEVCPDRCDESPGCCPATPIDDEIDYTGFNVQVLDGDCPCGAVSFSPTDEDGCAQFTLENCPASVTVCLVCQPYASMVRTWEHYRLAVTVPTVGTFLLEPSAGSCNPMSVTFDDVPFITSSPYGVCTGTISVTATRA